MNWIRYTIDLLFNKKGEMCCKMCFRTGEDKSSGFKVISKIADLNRDWDSVEMEKLAKSITAFMNSGGGAIFIEFDFSQNKAAFLNDKVVKGTPLDQHQQ
jgi:hypothetical protein